MQIRHQLISHYLPEFSPSLVFEGEIIHPPKPLSWYPDEFGWHISCSKKALRKCPELESFHQFLITETELGHIYRQEAVSMIPPMLLDIQPHHKILDMCAAPGSKTAQLIEALHGDFESSHQKSYLFPQEGLIIANDIDAKRCHMLIHQIKRLQSPSLMVTHYDASQFPLMTFYNEQHQLEPLLFDRILCDVPCSGDGTLRKNLLLWKKWNFFLAIDLHKLQLKLLQRACFLLKEHGLIVYSTCSLNPIENEAIIAALLTQFPGNKTFFFLLFL
jgi:16S rRNA C967 or C1407 C5-methylase (RsmB/RsmF family)